MKRRSSHHPKVMTQTALQTTWKNHYPSQSRHQVRLQMRASARGFRSQVYFAFTSTLGERQTHYKAMGANLSSHVRGVINMYGVFQAFYQSNLLEHESASNISWVGSVQAFLIFLGGGIVGPFFDLGYLGLLLSLVTFTTVFSMMMTSICKTYWQFVLAQGVTVGIGFGCLFLPSMAIVSQYFTTKKSIAFGIVSTGGSIGASRDIDSLMPNTSLTRSSGGFLYPIIFWQLQPQIWFWLDGPHKRLYHSHHAISAAARNALERAIIY